MKDYLVINPDVFVWRNENQYMVYNTASGEYHIGDIMPDMISVFEVLDDLSSLYKICLPDSWELKNISKFVHSVQITHAGKILRLEELKQCPVSLKPVLKVQNNIGYVNQMRDVISVIESIQCINIHLGGETRIPSSCRNMYSQVLFPMYGDKLIDIDALKTVIEFVPSGNNLIIRLFEYTSNRKEFVSWLIQKGYNVSVVLLVQESFLDSVIIESKELTCLGVNVEVVFNLSDLSSEAINLLISHNLNLRIVIDNPIQVERLNNLNLSTNKTIVQPYLHEKNFKEFIPLIKIEEDYFREVRMSKTNIFINSVLNTNYFGQFEILASGKILDAIGFNEIGDIHNFSSDDFLKLYDENGVWFQTRHKTSCKSCIYHNICIPPSRYENALKYYGICDKKHVSL